MDLSFCPLQCWYALKRIWTPEQACVGALTWLQNDGLRLDLGWQRCVHVLHALPTVSLPIGTCIHNAHAVIVHLQGRCMLPACWQERSLQANNHQTTTFAYSSFRATSYLGSISGMIDLAFYSDYCAEKSNYIESISHNFRLCNWPLRSGHKSCLCEKVSLKHYMLLLHFSRRPL